MKISLVVTVKNEEGAVSVFLESILGQTLKPSEVVVVDGGSTDDTVGAIRRFTGERKAPFPIRLFELQGANIARGRNRGISEANGDLIAISDAGCVLDESWLREITAPFEHEDVMIVAGNYRVEARGLWEAGVRAMTIPDPSRVAGALPSSRSIAFRKRLWEQAGGYPEDLDWAEDTAFALAVKRSGVIINFAPSAIVHWWPRGTPVSTFVQYLRYAIGDGMAGHFRRHYLLRCIGALVLIAMIALPLRTDQRIDWIYPAAFVMAYWLYFMGKVPPTMRIARNLLLSLPVLLISDAGRVIGYLIGMIRK